MVGFTNPYDLTITDGTSLILEAIIARDPQSNLPMLQRSYAPPLMAVATTQEDVTYTSIPREQGTDLAAQGVAGGAGAYDYTSGKYAFGESVDTESGLVYPGPAVVVTSVLAGDPVYGVSATISTSSAANPTVIATAGFHNLLSTDSITITGHSVSAVNGTWTPTPITDTTFSIPVASSGGVGGTLTLNALDGPVVASVRHYDSGQSAEVDYIAAGKSVYKWHVTLGKWIRTTLSVATSITPSGAGGTATITDLISFHNGTDRMLLVAFGSAMRYQVSTTDGGGWRDSLDASGDLKVKYWVVKELGETTPSIQAAVDPDVIYQVDNPDTGAWDTGTRVGYKDPTMDLFTSLTTSPITGETLVGKKLGWRTFSSDGDTISALGPVPVSNGSGADNFSKPTRLGGAVYAVLNDFDIVEYNQGAITTGFGVRRAGPRIPEMQAAIVALASDAYEFLYAALAGTSGYVMRGRYQDDGKWHWHGSLVKLNKAIGHMFVTSHPAATDKNLYLKVCPTASPYLPYRALISRSDLQTDTDARFSQSGNIRFGYMDAGQAHVYKVASKQTLQALNLSASDFWTPTFRTDDTAAFGGSPGTFIANGGSLFYPLNAYGKRHEFKMAYTGSSSTAKPAIVALITRVYRRPLRLRIGQVTILAHALQMNLAGAEDRTIGAQEASTLLDRLMNDIGLPLLDFSYNNDQVRFRAELTNVQQSIAKVGANPEGLAHALVFTLTFQELPTTDYSVSQTYQGSAP